VNVDDRDEIAAAVAAHGELGARYDSAIAEGLVERIGEEIDKRVEARLGGKPTPPRRGPAAAFAPPPARPELAQPESAYPAPRRNYGITGMILGLGSMGLGVGATAVVTHNAANGFAQAVMVLLIWGAIAFVNFAHSRRV
jgi:hypothetical protein